MKNISIAVYLLVLSMLLPSCRNTPLTIHEECQNSEVKIIQSEMTSLRDSINLPGLIHTVYFYLKSDLTIDQQHDFVAACKSLGSIPSVYRFRMGTPAGTKNRDVVDHSYDYALNIEFVNQDAQDAYQIHPIHLGFVEDHKDKWTSVKVYDNTVMK